MNAQRIALTVLAMVLASSASAGAAELADEYDCLVEARTTAEIRSPIEGLIEQVHVRRGDFVRKGQVVVTLESGPERAALALARSKATMKGPLEASASRLDFAVKKEQRAIELYKQKFVSAGALDEARTQRELAESELKEARENQKLNELEMQRAEEVVKLRTIRSPFNGVVIERYLSSGEFATANVKNPILKLAEVDPLNVEVILPANLYGRIKVGARAKVAPEAPGGEYTAVVVLVDRVIDAASGTFGVRLELPNANQQIPAGAKCRVKFPK
ncbi:MAG: efflux RND transporter periplasmic adaptor subunit [Burkholderiales bacterium]|jgi:RND family efflux transporter MFP subunit|nr:efflux RND transporter periplasmic adaptor subunit [Burkholderiales bacterium]